MRRPQHYCFAALLVGLAALASGCGSASPTEEDWAAGVCTAISTWKQEMRETVIRPTQQVRPAAGPGTRVTLFRAIARVRLLTRDLETELKQLDPPTATARKAHKALVDLVGELADGYPRTVQRSIERQFRKLPPEPTKRENARIVALLNRILRGASRDIVDHALAVMAIVEPSVKRSFFDADACDEVV